MREVLANGLLEFEKGFFRLFFCFA